MSDHNHQPDLPAPARRPWFSLAAWARILPFLVYMAFVLLEDMLARLGVDPQTLRYLYPVKIAAVLLTLIIFYRHYTELHRVRISPTGAMAAVAVGVLVFVLWISLNAGWMRIGASAGFDPRTAGALDPLLVAVRIAGAALVVPVMEELFWRSFVMRWIDNSDFESVDPARSSRMSVAITVVLFGFEHDLWLAGMVAGLAYSVLYMRQRTLWSAILAHAVTNGVLGAWIVVTASWSYW